MALKALAPTVMALNHWKSPDALAGEPEQLASGNAYSFQKHSYVAHSRYLEQLDCYEALFPKRQLLVLKNEDGFKSVRSRS